MLMLMLIRKTTPAQGGGKGREGKGEVLVRRKVGVAVPDRFFKIWGSHNIRARALDCALKVGSSAPLLI